MIDSAYLEMLPCAQHPSALQQITQRSSMHPHQLPHTPGDLEQISFANQQHGGLYVLPLFLIYFLTTSVRPIISKYMDPSLPNFQGWYNYNCR